MLVATSYPFLEVFWTILIFFVFVIWLSILFTMIFDIFRRHDISGGKKVLWIILLVVLPYFGVFIYLITQHTGMTERTIERQRNAQTEFDQYVQSAASKGDPAEQIAKAKSLLDSGAISQGEFDQLKQKALGTA